MVKLHPTMSHHYIPQPSMPLHLVGVVKGLLLVKEGGVESQHPRPPVKMHGEEVACKAPHSWDVCVYIYIYVYTRIYTNMDMHVQKRMCIYILYIL